MSRILVVEDSLDIAEGLQRSLEYDGYEVSLATKAAHALAVATADRPALIVLDLGLPDRDGYTVLEELRGRGVQTPVLILSARRDEADKLQGFRLGADDYVTKPFSILELMARISALLRRAGAAPAASSAPTAGAPAAEPAARPGPLSDEALRERYALTARQIEVARLLGEGCSNAEIATRLEMSYYTARNHTEQVLGKLGVSSRAAVGALLFGQG
ncbi:response regulator [Longimicrobium sp.]|uniref:response regulator n=1 Tax=Longimicrobium sp. TaxID=2029185 RepID=UPI002E33828C|nr:response regulator [Longimicrobium sp.]HEX6038179.1 response regulator [Longimicrobium sp.]